MPRFRRRLLPDLLMGLALLIAAAGIISVLLGVLEALGILNFRYVGITAALVGMASGVVLAAYFETTASTDRQRIEAAEQRILQTPERPQAAWDLARLTLESYLN